jgi:hypothetical protein
MNSTPSIVRLASNLTRDIEKAVARFPRSHKYVIGVDLRRRAVKAWETAQRAWIDRDQQPALVAKLVKKVDRLRISMQLAKALNAFGSFAEFEALARDLSNLGRQVGGWNKHLNPKGQNPTASAPAERASTLSTRAASKCEVNS